MLHMKKNSTCLPCLVARGFKGTIPRNFPPNKSPIRRPIRRPNSAEFFFCNFFYHPIPGQNYSVLCYIPRYNTNSLIKRPGIRWCKKLKSAVLYGATTDFRRRIGIRRPISAEIRPFFEHGKKYSLITNNF